MPIPPQIFQTWKTSAFSPGMAQAMATVRDLNPEFTYRFFDDAACRDYLQQHYPSDVLEAFDLLVPGAFKADLWRYAILYREGGVYVDADMVAYVPLREILQPTDALVSVKDRMPQEPSAIFQAFLAATPQHPILGRALALVLANVQQRRIPRSPLDVTGPVLLGRAFNQMRHQPDLEPLKPHVSYELGARLLWFDGGTHQVVDVQHRALFRTHFVGYGEERQEYSHMRWYHDQRGGGHEGVRVGLTLLLLLVLGGAACYVWSRHRRHLRRLPLV